MATKLSNLNFEYYIACTICYSFKSCIYTFFMYILCSSRKDESCTVLLELLYHDYDDHFCRVSITRYIH